MTALFHFCASAVLPGGCGNIGAPLLANCKPMNTPRILLSATVALVSFAAGAVDLRPTGAFVEAGVAKHSAYSVTAGVLWPWSWRRDFGHTELSGVTEAYVSQWSARGASERHGFTQLGLLPVVRMRLDGGSSPWFLEGGIGVSYMDNLYRSTNKEFSTRFNFMDVVGVGRSLGPDRRREVSLRFSHISNGGIKEPNPGENFLQLRYAFMF